MPKKFFDIIPPGRDKNPSRSQKIEFDYNEKEEKKKSFVVSSLKIQSKGQTFWQKRRAVVKTIVSLLFFLALISILSSLFLLKTKFLKINIEIWPKTKISTYETDVVLTTNNNKIDFEKKSIPGKIFDDQKIASKEFPASGKILKSKKAEGVIRVFNNYSTSIQPLLPHTRFVSDKGKLFRSVKREVIPGGYYVKGKFIAGFADIKVKAAAPGEDYNINPSTFSIPGFKGTPKYTYFYGKSFSSMTGGFKEEVSQVTEEDIKKAEAALSSKLKKESRDFLTKALPKDYVLLDEAIFQDITENSSSVKAGAEAKSFNLRLKVKSRGVGFKKLDMDRFVQEFIASNVSENEEFQKGSLEVNYSLKSSSLGKQDNMTDASKPEKTGNIILTVKIKAKVYHKINLIEFKKALSGKSLREAKTFLENLPYIAKVKIKSWLFFEKKIPDDINKIELKLNFNSYSLPKK